MTQAGTVADSARQLGTPDIDSRTTAKLTRSFFSSIARRSGVPGPGCNWLAPEAVWLAVAAAGERELSPEEFDHLGDAVRRGHGRPPKFEVVTLRNATHWDVRALDAVAGAVADVAPGPPLALSAGDDGTYRHNVGEAIRVLREVWPAAAVEFSLLIRKVVVLDELEMTGSHDQYFGQIVAGSYNLASVASAYEMILHETGHHAMFLRESFREFVTNPDDVVHHPLRADPRPVSGTLHAAFVLWRMYHGMRKWLACELAAGDAATEIVRRRDDVREKLDATIDVLTGSADWTDAGHTLFANIRDAEPA